MHFKGISNGSHQKGLTRGKAISRVLSLLTVCSALAVAACSSPSQPAVSAKSNSCPSTQSVGLETYPGNMVSMLAWVLVDQGFLAKNCLQGHFESFTSGTAATAASISGAVNFLALSPDTVYQPRAHGTDIEMIAGQNNTVYFQLGVPAGSPLAHESLSTVMNSLKGKTIGVNGLKNTTYNFALSNFRDVGVNPESAQYVALGALTAQVAALKYHRVDAVEFSGTGGAYAVALGVADIVPGANLFNLGQPGVGGPAVQGLNGAALVWAGYGPWLNAHSQVVREFIKANAEAVAWVKNPVNRKALYKVVATQVPPLSGLGTKASTVLQQMTDNYTQEVTNTQSMAALNAWNNYAVQSGEYSKPVSVEQAIWPEARKSLITG